MLTASQQQLLHASYSKAAHTSFIGQKPACRLACHLYPRGYPLCRQVQCNCPITLDWPVEGRRHPCGTPPLHLPTRLRMTAKPSPWSHHHFMTQRKYNDMRGKWAKLRHFKHCVVQLAAHCVDPTTSISPFPEHYCNAMLEPAQPPA
jgi:hypothetical protein